MLRGIGFAAAVALGAVAAWLIVTSTTQKRIEIGVLTGLWGLLLGAYSMFGARRALHELGPQPEAPSSALAVRDPEPAELDRAEDAAAKREWESRLEQFLRREINATMSHQLASVRGEIAQLRQDLLDKVGGQLRLERIETTRLIGSARLIGSDLEALLDEVRQLKAATESTAVSELISRSLRQVVEPARVRPASQPTAEVQADVRPAQRGPGERANAAAAGHVGVAGDASANAMANGIEADGRTTNGAGLTGVTTNGTGLTGVTTHGVARDEAVVHDSEPPAVRPRRSAPAATGPLRRQEAMLLPPMQRLGAPAADQRPSGPVSAIAASADTPQVDPAARGSATTRPAPARLSGSQRVEPQPAPPVSGDNAAAKPATAASLARAPVACNPSGRSQLRAEDPFAELPRIRPFTDFPLDPVDAVGDTRGAGNTAQANGARRELNGSGTADSPYSAGLATDYTGRRRRGGETDHVERADQVAADGADRPMGSVEEAADVAEEVEHLRHSGARAADAAEEVEDPRHSGARAVDSGGHRRRADGTDSGADLLGRLLARKAAER